MLSVLFYLSYDACCDWPFQGTVQFHCAARFIQGFGHNEVLSRLWFSR